MWLTDSDLPAEDLDQWWAAYLYIIYHRKHYKYLIVGSTITLLPGVGQY